jgi:hypothetical protein
MPEFEDRRRSSRLSITIPIRVQGTVGPARVVNETTRTLEINRHGARIILKNQVTPGTILQIANLGNNSTAAFRALRLEKPNSQGGEGGEWAIECLEEKRNIWGVEFPP